MTLEPNFILAGLTVVGSVAAAWGGARTAINSTKERVERVDEALAEHVQSDHEIQIDMVDRLARIETKLDAAIKGKQ